MLTDSQIQKRGERYAHSVIGYEKRVGWSTGQRDRLSVADAFIEGYKAAIQDRREFDVHQLDCHENCARGNHHKDCPWQKANDDLIREKF